MSVAAQTETPQPPPRTRLRGGEVWGLLCLLFMHPTLAGNCEAGNGKVSSLPQVAAGKRSDGSRLILTAEPSRGPAAAQRDFRAAVSGINGSSIAVLTVNRWGTRRVSPTAHAPGRVRSCSRALIPSRRGPAQLWGEGDVAPGISPAAAKGSAAQQAPGRFRRDPRGRGQQIALLPRAAE